MQNKELCILSLYSRVHRTWVIFANTWSKFVVGHFAAMFLTLIMNDMMK